MPQPVSPAATVQPGWRTSMLAGPALPALPAVTGAAASEAACWQRQRAAGAGEETAKLARPSMPTAGDPTWLSLDDSFGWRSRSLDGDWGVAVPAAGVHVRRSSRAGGSGKHGGGR